MGVKIRRAAVLIQRIIMFSREALINHVVYGQSLNVVIDDALIPIGYIVHHPSILRLL